MKNLLKRMLALVMLIILICESMIYISAYAESTEELLEIMVYADEEYFSDIDSALNELFLITENNAEIIDTYTHALFGFSARVPAGYVKIIDNSDFFEAHLCGYFSKLSAVETGFEASAVYASDMLNVTKVHESGYTGSGRVVAVIDNGFDVSHEVFANAPKNPAIKKEDIETLISENKLSLSKNIKSADGIYLSEKIPFVFDYTTASTDVSTLDNHGTHVAAIIGGKSETMTGVAPDCQLLLMKVFSQNATNAAEYFVVSALEDAVALGADVINLSLGTYSGSVSSTKYSSINRIAKRLKNAGISVVCAAGNDGTSGYNSTFSNDYGIPYPLAQIVDFGTTSHPAVIQDFIAVGSAQNTYVSSDVLIHTDENGVTKRMNYVDTNASLGILETSFTKHFSPGKIEYVSIPGTGSEEDYLNIADLSGKIALIERGVIPFYEKANIAAKYGAVGAVIYGNTDEAEVYMDISGCSIPAVYITKEYGNYLKNSNTKILIFDDNAGEFTENAQAYTMSSFSSWGTTPEMKLKPDITSVGESVYSAANNNTYTSLSGTSMATPFVSGLAALICEKLDSEESEYILSKRPDYVKNALTFSAKPLINPMTGAEYSPRQQGAGLADIGKALDTEFIISGKSNSSYLELKKETDDGRYSLEFTVENLTDKKKEMSLSTTTLTDTYINLTLENKSREKEYSFNTLNSKCINSVVLSAEEDSGLVPGETEGSLKFTLDENETCSVKLFITLNPDELGEGASESGYFIDGFLYARTKDFEGSVPFMGFEGNFNKSDIFDATVYSDEIPFFSGNALLSNTAKHELITLGAPDTPGDDVIPAFSPNSDMDLDYLLLSLSLLRNIGSYSIDILDSDGNIIYNYPGSSFPMTKGYQNTMYIWDGRDTQNENYIFPDGNYTLRITASTVDSRNTQQMSLDFMIDTTAPESAKTEISKVDGRRLVTLSAIDESKIKSVTLYETKGQDSKKEDVFSVTKNYDGDDLFTFDITGIRNTVLWADITDFAMNTKTVRVNIP